ncbi:MAG TPA: hypothetical protein PKJ39_01155 [Caldisericia bacterium]|nr:hypothetical protein [Caldisericia bacterium]HQL66224.1 hypothetical protein [Caldisericia bacterium]
MPNPLSSITPLLEILGKEIKILPATGGAVEDLQHPDQEEIEDIVINNEMENITAFAEIPEPDPQNIYYHTPLLSRTQKHLFQFFIDGSIRTYFLGTGIEGTRTFPIELSQIGSAVIKREDDGELRVFDHKQRIVLLLPRQNQGLSDSIWNQIQKIEKPDFLEVADFTLPDKLADIKKDPRDKAGAKARSLMHKLEIDLIKSTNSYRNENRWLIIDGAVKFVEEDIWNSWRQNPYLIGVAKSFRKDPVFQFGHRTSQRKDITGILAGLPHAHRTAVFSAFDGQVAFWYVRLREQKELDYPLMGVIKVEFPCPDRKPIPSELANLISSALIAERNVTPYGLDRRWHCSLYPIHIAEEVIKNRFFSSEVLIGCIKWSKPQIGGGL